MSNDESNTVFSDVRTQLEDAMRVHKVAAMMAACVYQQRPHADSLAGAVEDVAQRLGFDTEALWGALGDVERQAEASPAIERMTDFLASRTS